MEYKSTVWQIIANVFFDVIMVILLGEGKLPSVGRRVSQNIEISTSLFYGTMSFINGRIFYEKIYSSRKIYERGN